MFFIASTLRALIWSFIAPISVKLITGEVLGPMLSPSCTPVFRPASKSARLRAGLTLSLALTACDPPEKSLVHHQPVSVANRVLILNADTLVIDGRHVHLSNASTPQTTLHSRCWA